MLQTGQLLHNRYRILRIIGKGGMSTVYQAENLQNGNLLAVKDVIRSGQENQTVVEQSLSAEGRMLMQLSNPHLPRIYEIMEENDSIMLVMDFIQGESLDKVILREGPQSMERVLNWGMQICEVFHYLHSQPTPIIYRDMKPANVMLQPDGKLMMIDFGTARTQKVGVAMQADTVCIGTEGFAAPEQYGGIGQSTAKTDIFCLGATLYNMITGHSPSDKPTGILPLEYWNPALADTPLAEIITKCTRNDPDERYATALELYEDLRLASIGAYRGKKKERGNPFSGRQDWQKQDVQGKGMITGGLSDVLQRGLSSISGQLSGKEENQLPEQTAGSTPAAHWQTAPARGAIPTPAAAAEAETGEGNTLTGRLILIAMLVAAIFVTLAVVLLVLKQTGAAAVFMVIALISAVTGALMLLISGRRGS